jgi:hypothetical protein
VTGNDAQGRSRVLIDSAAPGVKTNTFKKGTGMTDIWLWESSPAPISGERDDGNVPLATPAANSGHSDPKLAITRRSVGGTWTEGRRRWSSFKTL